MIPTVCDISVQKSFGTAISSLPTKPGGWDAVVENSEALSFLWLSLSASLETIGLHIKSASGILDSHFCIVQKISLKHSSITGYLHHGHGHM
jgi:hypothetical protein